MSSSVILIVAAFVVIASGAILVAWWYARRLKQDLDEAPSQLGASRGTIDLAAGSVERLRQLTPEPILLKQSIEGVRVQIERRPMLPIMAFAGTPASGAIAETAAQLTKRYGAKWVVLVSADEHGKVAVQRLA